MVRYCLERFTQPYDWVLDPFAGSGAVGTECLVTRRNATLVDINPISDLLVKAKTLIPLEDARFEMRQLLLKSLSYAGEPFAPKWKNIEYWHPPQVIEFLSKVWGYIHNECTSCLKPLLIFVALNITRLLSYTDDQVPKLYKSKRKTKKLDKLLTKNWKKIAINRYKKVAENYIDSIFDLKEEFRKYSKGKIPSIEVHAPQDIDSWNPERSYKVIITSPPYLQAQEYIRSSKIDLYWLGYGDKKIRALSRLEIPYRTLPWHTRTFRTIRSELMNSDKTDLIELFESYFYFVLSSLLRMSRKLQPKGRLCIFVGSPTIDGITVPLWKIICEYFRQYGFTDENIYEDKIVARKLFGQRDNLNPEGIVSEHLTILKRV